MATYPPGPYILDIPYTVSGLSHNLTINCDVIGTPAIGAAPNTIELETKNGEGILLSGAADELWGVLRPAMTTQALASTYTLWKANEDNGEKTFVSGGSLTTPNGSLVDAPMLTSQVTLTWRSARGNYARLQIMESAFAGAARLPLLSSGHAVLYAISAYVLGPTSVVMARDRSFLIVPMNASFDPQNGTLHNRRNRS